MKSLLSPEPVPWMISESVLSALIDEETGCVITFEAWFAIEDKLHANGAFEPIYKRIRLDFDHIPFIKVYSYISEIESKYDYSSVFQIALDRPVAAEQMRLRSIWAETGSCPSPGMYQIVNSEELKDIPNSSQLKHFLIQGHDLWVELFVSGYEWTVVDE